MNSPLPLQGITVVALEQAVAAPSATRQLADLGARVIKIERAEGDFARRYDKSVHGESSYFVWLNRGKKSVTLDIKDDADRAVLVAILATADVFVQNLAPGAAARLVENALADRSGDEVILALDETGIATARLRTMAEFAEHPALVESDRWRDVETPGGSARSLLPPVRIAGREAAMAAVPSVGQHTESIKAEFGDRSDSPR